MSSVLHILCASVCHPKFNVYIDWLSTVSAVSRVIEHKAVVDLFTIEDFDRVNRLESRMASHTPGIPNLGHEVQPVHLENAPSGPLPLQYFGKQDPPLIFTGSIDPESLASTETLYCKPSRIPSVLIIPIAIKHSVLPVPSIHVYHVNWLDVLSMKP